MSTKQYAPPIAFSVLSGHLAEPTTTAND